MTEQPTGARGSSLVEIAAASIRQRGRPLLRTLFPARALYAAHSVRAGRTLMALTGAALLAAATMAALASGLAALQERANRAAADESARQTTARTRYVAVIEHRPAIAAIMEAEPITTTLGRLAGRVPPQAQLGAVGRDRSGRLRVEITLSDPDLAEGLFAGDPVLRTLRASRQWSEDSGRLRVVMTEPR